MIKLKLLIESFTDEAVKFSKFGDVVKGLEKKYGSNLLAGTFGIEFEYLGDARDAVLSYEEFFEMNNQRLENNFKEWLQSKRDEINSDYIEGETDEWDNEYGPMDTYAWKQRYPSPKSHTYEDQIKWKADYDKWTDLFNEVKRNYEHWEGGSEWTDMFDNFATSEYNEDNSESYITTYNNDDESQSHVIESTITFIKSLGENCIYGDDANRNTWAVGMDDKNVELRSRYLTIDDFTILEKVMEFLSDKHTTGNMSAHVHVGLPANFNAFDLLAMWNLVDEQQVTKDIGMGRNLTQWAKLQDHLSSTLYGYLSTISPEPGAINTFSMKSLENRLTRAEKYSGTNLKAFFDHNTVEFRYFSSNIKENPKLFFQWIKYFLVLPKIAQSRNQVILKSHYEKRKIVVTRVDDDTVKIDKLSLGKKVTKPNLPISQLSTKKEDPNLTLKQKLAKKFGKTVTEPEIKFRSHTSNVDQTMNELGYVIDRVASADTQGRTVYANNRRDKILYVYPDLHVRYVYAYIGNGGLRNWTHHDFPTWNDFITFSTYGDENQEIPTIRGT